MIELKELTTRILKLFAIDDVDQLGDSLLDCVMANDTDKFKQFVDAVNGDLSKDWLQMIYQYHLADRDNLKQDYTPKSLGQLLAQYASNTGATEIIDLCAGSGALTIQQWELNKDLEINCAEIDAGVIPYLLFNLAVRNISGIVQHKDILKNVVFAKYTLSRGDHFATVHQQPAVQSQMDAS